MLSKQVLRANFWNATRKFWLTFILTLAGAEAFIASATLLGIYIFTPPNVAENGVRSLKDLKQKFTDYTVNGHPVDTNLWSVWGNGTHLTNSSITDDVTTYTLWKEGGTHFEGDVEIDGNLTVHGDIECKSSSTKSGTQTSKPKHKHKR